MRSTVSFVSAVLALSTLISALPQQSEQSTALAINPINGLPLPVAESSASATVTADTEKPTSDDSTDAQTSDSESDSSRATITTAPTRTLGPSSPKSTDSESDSDSDASSSSSSDPELIIWTDTAENTIYTMTRVTSTSTSEIPDPTVGVPPDHEHATVMVEVTNAAGQEEVVPTRSVDTFVQAYTGAAAPLAVGEKRRERVWWLLGLVGAVGLL